MNQNKERLIDNWEIGINEKGETERNSERNESEIIHKKKMQKKDKKKI